MTLKLSFVLTRMKVQTVATSALLFRPGQLLSCRLQTFENKMQFERKIVLPEVTVLFLGFENMPHWKARERSGLWHFSYSSSLITENGDSFSWNSDRQLSQLLGFCGEGFQWCNWQIQLPCQHKQVKVKLGRKNQNFTLVAEALISKPGYRCRQTPMCATMEIGAVYHRPWSFRETWLLPCSTSLCQPF